MSFNGLLTYGLMGDVNNLLLASHYLQLEVEVVVEPIPSNISAGGGSIRPKDQRAYLHFRIKYKDREVKRSYEMSEKNATFVLKRIKAAQKATEKVSIMISSITKKS